MEKDFLVCFGQSFEREGREIMFFTLKNVFIICRSCLSAISVRLGFALSVTFHAECKSSSAEHNILC